MKSYTNTNNEILKESENWTTQKEIEESIEAISQSDKYLAKEFLRITIQIENENY